MEQSEDDTNVIQTGQLHTPTLRTRTRGCHEKADGDAKKASTPFFAWLENVEAELDEAD